MKAGVTDGRRWSLFGWDVPGTGWMAPPCGSGATRWCNGRFCGRSCAGANRALVAERRHRVLDGHGRRRKRNSRAFMKISPLASEICPVKRWSVGRFLEIWPLPPHIRGAAGGSWRVATVPPSANPRLRGRANPAGLGACARRHNFPVVRHRRLPALYPCSSVLSVPSVILTAKASAKREVVVLKGRAWWVTCFVGDLQLA